MKSVAPPPTMPPLTPEQLGPFVAGLGLRAIEAGGGKARFALTVARQHLRSLEMAHGGVVAAMLDSVQGMSAHSLAPDGHYTVTVQLNLNYTRPALPGDELLATGECVHRGKRTAVTRGEVRNQRDELVATGSATMMYVPRQS